MTIFSWVFMLGFVMVYLACVGFSKKELRKGVLLGEVDEVSILDEYVTGPYFYFKGFLFDNIDWLMIGVKLLYNSDLREKFVLKEIELEEDRSTLEEEK